MRKLKRKDFQNETDHEFSVQVEWIQQIVKCKFYRTSPSEEIRNKSVIKKQNRSKFLITFDERTKI